MKGPCRARARPRACNSRGRPVGAHGYRTQVAVRAHTGRPCAGAVATHIENRGEARLDAGRPLIKRFAFLHDDAGREHETSGRGIAAVGVRHDVDDGRHHGAQRRLVIQRALALEARSAREELDGIELLRGRVARKLHDALAAAEALCCAAQHEAAEEERAALCHEVQRVRQHLQPLPTHEHATAHHAMMPRQFHRTCRATPCRNRFPANSTHAPAAGSTAVPAACSRPCSGLRVQGGAQSSCWACCLLRDGADTLRCAPPASLRPH